MAQPEVQLIDLVITEADLPSVESQGSAIRFGYSTLPRTPETPALWLQQQGPDCIPCLPCNSLARIPNVPNPPQTAEGVRTEVNCVRLQGGRSILGPSEYLHIDDIALFLEARWFKLAQFRLRDSDLSFATESVGVVISRMDTANSVLVFSLANRHAVGVLRDQNGYTLLDSTHEQPRPLSATEFTQFISKSLRQRPANAQEGDLCEPVYYVVRESVCGMGSPTGRVA